MPTSKLQMVNCPQFHLSSEKRFLGAVVPAELAHIAAFQGAWESRGVLAESIEIRVATTKAALRVA